MSDPTPTAEDRLREIAETAAAAGWPTKDWVEAVTPEVVLDLLDDLRDLRDGYDELAQEHSSAEHMAATMALAIGWGTRGDTWVEKAANWSQATDSLPALYSELLELRRKVNAYENGDLQEASR